MGLLIYSSYQTELRDLLAQTKLTPKNEFNPMSAKAIGDPTLLAKLSKAERSTEARKLYQERMLAMCSRMPKKHLGVAILHHFTSLSHDDKHRIDQECWSRFQEQNPKSIVPCQNIMVTT